MTYLWYHFLPLIAWKKLLSAFTKLVPTLHFSERIELIIMHHCLHNMVSLYLSSTSLFHGFNFSISCGARFMHPLQEAKNSTCISSDFFLIIIGEVYFCIHSIIHVPPRCWISISILPLRKSKCTLQLL